MNLGQINEPVEMREVVADIGVDKVSCLYMSPFLTSDAKNHNHVFIGMDSGTVHIYDIPRRQFTDCVITGPKQPEGDLDLPLKVCDIKSQPEKMHKVLIAHEKHSVCLYNLHKLAKIQEVNINYE